VTRDAEVDLQRRVGERAGADGEAREQERSALELRHAVDDVVVRRVEQRVDRRAALEVVAEEHALA